MNNLNVLKYNDSLGDIKPKLIDSKNFKPEFRNKSVPNSKCKGCPIAELIEVLEISKEVGYEIYCDECELYYEE